MDVIRVKDVWVSYHGIHALEGVSLTVREKDFLGIIGPNGGGKTTLLRVILGLVKPERGHVEIMGHPPEEGRRFIGYVPQSVQLDQFFPIRVWDVVMMGRLGKRSLFKGYDQHDKEMTASCLQKVEMEDLKDRRMGELSWGQRQRVLIARALAHEPQILLLDEPTASLDTRFEVSLYELLKELNKEVTIVMVSHDIGVISAYVKTIACLNRRLIYHHSKEITPQMLQEAYQCPVDLIAHGLPHRVLEEHREG